jgi:hypothetical protein
MADEAEALADAINRFGAHAWESVAHELANQGFKGRTAMACHRWYALTLRPTTNVMRKSPLKKPGSAGSAGQGRWKPEEDEALRGAIAVYGDVADWVAVASRVPGRTAQDCQIRWHYQLNPQIKQGPWSELEDERLAALIAEHGPCNWQYVGRPL